MFNHTTTCNRNKARQQNKTEQPHTISLTTPYNKTTIDKATIVQGNKCRTEKASYWTTLKVLYVHLVKIFESSDYSIPFESSIFPRYSKILDNLSDKHYRLLTNQ